MKHIAHGRLILVGLLVALSYLGTCALTSVLGQIGAPPIPEENPITNEKAILGKILFWEEQLSSDNTMACGTCHRPEVGGADPRSVRTFGPDGALGTADDTYGSPGVLLSDETVKYKPHDLHRFAPQVTPRLSPSVFMAGMDEELFWDGRASDVLVDPETGSVVIPAGAALENLSLMPPVNSVEMAHEGRSWDQVLAKLAAVNPLHLASALPQDVEDALRTNPTYPDLFRSAFGDSMISGSRVAMAIATYIRTLVPDQTPYDRGELTIRERAGFDLFRGRARCINCHHIDDFTDHLYHNTGIRPALEDPGRMLVTGRPEDIGKFKTPSLRNVGLRPRLTHAGSFASLEEIVDFYERGGDFHEHQDPRIAPIDPPLAEYEKQQLIEFLRTGITDPRVAGSLYPYDRPKLFSERATRNPNILGTGHPGTNGITPKLIANTPPSMPNPTFRIGIYDALASAHSVLAIAPNPAPRESVRRGLPVQIALTPRPILFRVRLSGDHGTSGYGTFVKSIKRRPGLIGTTIYAQWFVRDAGASGGLSATATAKIEFF